MNTCIAAFCTEDKSVNTRRPAGEVENCPNVNFEPAAFLRDFSIKNK